MIMEIWLKQKIGLQNWLKQVQCPIQIWRQFVSSGEPLVVVLRIICNGQLLPKGQIEIFMFELQQQSLNQH